MTTITTATNTVVVIVIVTIVRVRKNRDETVELFDQGEGKEGQYQMRRKLHRENIVFYAGTYKYRDALFKHINHLFSIYME